MALAIQYDWQVTINGRWTYTVRGPFAAEAEHLAVTQWRKDDRVPDVLRKSFIHTILTKCLAFQGK